MNERLNQGTTKYMEDKMSQREFGLGLFAHM
jgi:hypothetical protein